MCFDEGLLTPKTVITDVPVNYEGYAPENYDEKFNGYVTIETALEHSLNIPAVKCLRLLGYEQLINKLSAINFRQIQKDRRKLGLSMILVAVVPALKSLLLYLLHLPMMECIILLLFCKQILFCQV
jgi:penicillin-binding protein 1C